MYNQFKYYVLLSVAVNASRKCVLCSRSRGKMEHWEKWNTGCFGKKYAGSVVWVCGVVWVCCCVRSLASAAWHIKTKLTDDRIIHSTQNAISPFSWFLYILSHSHSDVDCFDEISRRTADCCWIYFFYLFYVFSHHFDRAVGDIIIGMTRYIQT